MTAQYGLEHGLRAWLRSQEAMPDYLPDVLGITKGTPQRRPTITARLVDGLERRYPVANRRLVTIAVVGVLVATLLGSVLLIAGTVPVPDPRTSTPVPTGESSPAASPPTMPPPSASPLAIDPLQEPFPAALREEPFSGAPVVEPFDTPELPHEHDRHAWFDPREDGEPEVDPRVDLVTVDFYPTLGCLTVHTICVFYETAQVFDFDQGLPDPKTGQIAYGMVIDIDADGQPDQRFGIDNLPGDDLGFVRAWLTNFENGSTVVVRGDGFYGEAEFPYATGTRLSNRGYMWVHAPQITFLGGPAGRFYLWSALIRDGRIVSLDFAPDTGWLEVLLPTGG